jgi:hypothetical protein
MPVPYRVPLWVAEYQMHARHYALKGIWLIAWSIFSLVFLFANKASSTDCNVSNFVLTKLTT